MALQFYTVLDIIFRQIVEELLKRLKKRDSDLIFSYCSYLFFALPESGIQERYTEVYRSGHNGPDSKSGSLVRGSWVRIPPLPPTRKHPADAGCFLRFALHKRTEIREKQKKMPMCKIGFTDLTGMVSCEYIRLSRNSEGLTLHLFPLRSPNRTPILEKYF